MSLKKDNYTILIADIEEFSHSNTKLILKDYRHKDKSLKFISTFGLDETKIFLKKNNNDIDVIIFDLNLVDLNYKDGLNFINFVRKELKNEIIRFIIRSGKFKKIEGRLISNYKIYEDFEYDFKDTTELTLPRYKACVTTALRSYEDLMIISNQKRMLIEQSKSVLMGDMIDSIAHQWSNPLSIIGLIGLSIKHNMDGYAINKEENKDLAKKLMSQVRHLKETLNEFRGFFRNDKKQEEFLIKDIIDNALMLSQDDLMKYKITIQIIGDLNIKSLGYPNELKHVILNIINNSKDAFVTKSEDKNINNRRVYIEIHKDNNIPTISIFDNAGGIPEHILPNIFNPNFTTKKNGSGVGLYLSKMIVEDSMSGKIFAQNIGNGAKFQIELPL